MFLHAEIRRRDTHSNDEVIWRDVSSAEYYCFESILGKIKLRRRKAYPTTFATAKNGGLIFGYGNTDNDTTEEYLLIVIDARGAVTIKRDIYCTLPLFYRMNKERFVLGDSISSVLDHTGNVNTTALGDLLLSPNINLSTLFLGVRLCAPGVMRWPEWIPTGLIADNSNHNIGFNDDEISVPARFGDVLQKNIESLYSQTFGRGSVVAFESSGGIDSATNPLVVHQLAGDRLLIGAMSFTDDFGRTQRQKLEELARYVNGEVLFTSFDPDRHAPLKRFFKTDSTFSPYAEYQYQEIYSEALDELAQNFSSRGVDVVFTGIGGDELFENIGSAVMTKDEPIAPDFIDEGFSLGGADKNDQQLLFGRLPISDSAFYAGQSRNAIYIKHGIWPVSPFLRPYLYTFTQSLDIVFRSNKNILRAYLQASSFPEKIFNPIRNEHFGRFFEDAILHNMQMYQHKIMRGSKLAEMGIIDTKKFLEFCDEAKSKEQNSFELFMIFRIFNAECILQYQTDRT